jgi:predicted membrane protein
MKNRIAKAVIWWIAANVVVWGVLQLVARKLSSGDETGDDVELYTIWCGNQFRSTAQQLRSIRAVTTMGGLELDLRSAAIGPEGADVTIRTTLGGTSLLVRRDWRVLVNEETSNAEFEDRTEDPEGLPDDAPVVRVNASTRLGGALVAYDSPRK